jgi:hypothetical protein
MIEKIGYLKSWMRNNMAAEASDIEGIEVDEADLDN